MEKILVKNVINKVCQIIRLNREIVLRICLSLILLATSIQPFLFPIKAKAATTGYIRTDRMGSNVTSTGLVCLTPLTAGTEAKVVITFPGTGTQSSTSYGVNSTADATHWSVSTSNIPSGSTAWPGINTATAVSGAAVTFPSTDLTTSTQYCFQFTGTGLTTPTGANTNNAGSIQTQTSGNTPIDTVSLALANVASNNDQISVTATVSPIFSFSLGSNTAALGTLSTSTATSATGITATVSTNAANGWLSWVKSANGALNSTSTGASITAGTYVNSTSNLIDLASTAGSNYILDVVTGTNSPSIDAAYSGTATNGNSTSGGHIDTNYQRIAFQTAPANASTFTLAVRARAAVTQQAATDYADTLTVVAAGQF